MAIRTPSSLSPLRTSSARVGVGEDRVLGDLELERAPARRATWRAASATSSGSAASSRSRRRDVDRDRQVERAARATAPHWRDRGLAGRTRQLPDQAGALGERDELDPAAASPRSGCCQRTSASTPRRVPGRRVDLRLVVHDQLVAVDRRAAGRRRRSRAGRVLVLLGRVERRARASPCRGTSPRRRGASVSSTSSRALGRGRCPTLASTSSVRSPIAIWRMSVRPSFSASRSGAVAVGDARRQDAELVAAEAGDGVADPGHAAQTAADLLQEQVAREVLRACR